MSKFVKEKRKSRVLGKGLPQCLAGSGTYALNVISGCPLQCNYCKYRARHPETAEQVVLYSDLPRQLAEELDALESRGQKPRMILFNTVTEAFFGNGRANAAAKECLSLLISRGIFVNISTKGLVPRELYEVLAARPELVTVTCSISSFSESFQRLFEPRVVLAEDRLTRVRELTEVGVPVRGRIEPLIPMENDTRQQVRELVRRFRRAGVREIVTAYLQMGPEVSRRLRERAGRVELTMLLPWFRDQDGAPTYLLDRDYRERKYKEIKEIGAEFGVRMVVCACRNADMFTGRCFVMPAALEPTPARRLL